MFCATLCRARATSWTTTSLCSAWTKPSCWPEHIPSVLSAPPRASPLTEHRPTTRLPFTEHLSTARLTPYWAPVDLSPRPLLSTRPSLTSPLTKHPSIADLAPYWVSVHRSPRPLLSTRPSLTSPLILSSHKMLSKRQELHLQYWRKIIESSSNFSCRL